MKIFWRNILSSITFSGFFSFLLTAIAFTMKRNAQKWTQPKPMAEGFPDFPTKKFFYQLLVAVIKVFFPIWFCTIGMLLACFSIRIATFAIGEKFFKRSKRMIIKIKEINPNYFGKED